MTRGNAGNLIMEKCKKLSLKKRKVQATNESKMKLETKNTVKLFDTLLSPENDAERIEISPEQRRKPSKDSESERTAAYTDDPNLQKLRELMMKISSRENENGKTLQPFPLHISDNLPLQNLTKQDLSKERQLCHMNFTVCDGELLPFPPLPTKFIQRKRQKLLEDDNSFAGSSISLINHVEDNAPSKYPNAKGPATCQSLGKSNMADFQKGERNASILFNSTKTDLPGAQSRRNEASPPPQNCHLIRDRNSNYYSLQSQNQKQPEQKCNTSPNTTTSTSNIRSSKLSAFTKPSAFAKSSANTKSSIFTKSSAQREDVENLGDEFHQHSGIAISNSASKSKHSDLKSPQSLYSNHVKSVATSVKQLDRNTDVRDSIVFSPMEEDLFSPEKETKSDILQKCPLCQQDFPRNSTQMEVDSHIAQCLSNSGDDVLW